MLLLLAASKKCNKSSYNVVMDTYHPIRRNTAKGTRGNRIYNNKKCVKSHDIEDAFYDTFSWRVIKPFEWVFEETGKLHLLHEMYWVPTPIS